MCSSKFACYMWGGKFADLSAPGGFTVAGRRSVEVRTHPSLGNGRCYGLARCGCTCIRVSRKRRRHTGRLIRSRTRLLWRDENRAHYELPSGRQGRLSSVCRSARNRRGHDVGDSAGLVSQDVRGMCTMQLHQREPAVSRLQLVPCVRHPAAPKRHRRLLQNRGRAQQHHAPPGVAAWHPREEDRP